MSSKRFKASIIRLDDFCVPSLRLRISSATTAKPFPASPALAASMEAFKASRFVCDAIPSMVPVSSLTIPNSFLNSPKILSTSADNGAIVLVDSTTPSNSLELCCAWDTDSCTRCNISSTKLATFSTCVLMPVVILIEDIVLSYNTELLFDSSCMLLTTFPAPSLFSSASSRTTVTPSTTALLAILTLLIVSTTLSRFSLIESAYAPSDLFI